MVKNVSARTTTVVLNFNLTGATTAYPTCFACFLLLCSGIRQIWIKRCLIMPRGLIVGSAFAILGCFGVYALSVLGVFPWVSQPCHL